MHKIIFQAFSLVQLTGLEPEPTYVDMNLNHARMPIPPQLHIAIDFSKTITIITNDSIKNKSFFKKIFFLK